MAKKKGKTGDRLPDLPLPDIPFYGPLGGLLGLAIRNPYIPTALGAYALAENTERWWGPPVEQSAQWTAKQWEEYQDWYERNIRAQYAGTQVPFQDVRKPMQVMATGEAKVEKPKKRKVSTSNKAMSGLYKFLLKEQKGRNTQAKNRKLLAQCAKIVGKANPNTKSRIGKGKSKNQKLARKCRMDYLGTKKRN